MSMFTAIYEGRPGHQPELRGDEPKPRGLRLLWVTFCRQAWVIVKLNFYFCAACLPLVTIPAALKAMSKICVTLLRDEPCDLLRDFWAAFREHFFKVTGIGLACAALLGAGCFGVWFYGQAMKSSGLFAVPVLLLILALALAVMTLMYVLPLASYSELRFGEMARSALCLAVVRLPQNLAAVAVAAGAVFLVFLGLPYTALLLPSIFFSLIALIVNFTVWPGLERYVFHTDGTPAIEKGA